MTKFNTLTLVVGQEVAVIRHSNSIGHRRSADYGFTVQKVSPTGQVTVISTGGKERKFDANCNEMAHRSNYVSSSRYDRDSLCADVNGLRHEDAKHARIQTARAAVSAVKPGEDRSYWHVSQEGLAAQIVQLENALALAKAAVAAI